MSLKAVHLAFIVVSTALCVFFSVWSMMQYNTGHAGAMLGGSIAAMLAAAALVVYATRFLRKFRNVRSF